VEAHLLDGAESGTTPVSQPVTGDDPAGTDCGHDDVLWLRRAEPRRARPWASVATCAAAAALGTVAFVVGIPPRFPLAEASVAGAVMPAPVVASARVSPPMPGPALAESLPVPTAAPADGLTGAAVAAIVEDATPAVLDRVTPEAMRGAAEAAGPRDPDEVLSFGPMRVRRGIVETILRAARDTSGDPVLLMAIADKESSLAVRAKASTSSAEGLFQFIESTWMRVVRDFGAAHGLAAEAGLVAEGPDGLDISDPQERARVLGLRRDPYLSAVMASEMLSRDATRIGSRIGRPLTHGEIYIAHFLGPDDAGAFMDKVANSPGTVAARILPRPARANRPIFFASGRRKPRGLSVAQVHRKFEEMMGLRTERYRAVAGTAALAYASAEPPAR